MRVPTCKNIYDTRKKRNRGNYPGKEKLFHTLDNDYKVCVLGGFKIPSVNVSVRHKKVLEDRNMLNFNYTVPLYICRLLSIILVLSAIDLNDFS